jgi:glutathione reductase (NADPH)
LTPVAGLGGEIVAENLLSGNRRKADFARIASIVYSIPPLASVGLSETRAKALGVPYRVSAGDSVEWYSSRRLAVEASGYKILVEEQTDRVLGVHLLGPHAEEQANVLALAMRAGIRIGEIKDTLFAYPTGSSDLEYML